MQTALRSTLLAGFLLSTLGCAYLPVTTPDTDPARQNGATAHEASGQRVRCTLALHDLDFSDSPCTLLAWQQFVQDSTTLDPETRQQRIAAVPASAVGSLQAALLRHHAGAPHLVRLHSQAQLLDVIPALPDGLARYFQWLVSQQQQLLETELTVQTLSRLNTQQQQDINRLRAENAEKSAQIQALSDIEAQLNAYQPATTEPPAETQEATDDE